VGKFSTYKQWTLDDRTAPFDEGRTLSSRQFLDELKEKYVEPARRYMREDPMVLLLANENVTDEQYFKLLAQRWNFERSVGAIHATWLLNYTLGMHGELQEVENMEVRQIYEEYKHARLHEDAILKKGYLDTRWELHSHPMAQLLPEGMAFHTFLQRLGNMPVPVRAAANHIATEAPLVYWFDLAGRLTRDEIVAGVFEAQVIEETEHGHIGEYVVERYCTTSDLQAMTRYICEHVAELVRRHRQSIYDFVVAEDADRLVVRAADGTIKPMKHGANIKPNRDLSF
jgi:hypothetical protein